MQRKYLSCTTVGSFVAGCVAALAVMDCVAPLFFCHVWGFDTGGTDVAAAAAVANAYSSPSLLHPH
jgi:cytochrome c biogenesis protein CcdA